MDFNGSVYNISNGSYQTELENGKIIVIPRSCQIILVVYLSITCVLAIFGNCLILMVEIKNRFKTSTDWLVCFMAVNDILLATFCIPMYVIMHMGYWAEIASDVLCKFHFYINEVTMFSSALLLGTVAIDRYFKTCR